MAPEAAPDETPRGERWLELLGYSHLKGQPSGYAIDGQPVPVEEFDKLCGSHARPIFTALESMDPGDRRYQGYMNVARKAFEGYFGPTPAPESDS